MDSVSAAMLHKGQNRSNELKLLPDSQMLLQMIVSDSKLQLWVK